MFAFEILLKSQNNNLDQFYENILQTNNYGWNIFVNTPNWVWLWAA